MKTLLFVVAILSVYLSQEAAAKDIDDETDLITAAQHHYQHKEHHPTSSHKSHWDKGHSGHG